MDLSSAKEQIVETLLGYYPDAQAIYLFGTYGTEYERAGSDVDIAVLLAPLEARQAGSLAMSESHGALAALLRREVDLINLRSVSTVLQKEVIMAEQRLYTGDAFAADEFEMLTVSFYQKLNEERSGIIDEALAGGRFHQV